MNRTMTSLLRGFPSGQSLPSAAGFIAAGFTNSDGYVQPFPWRFNKRTGQIDLEFVDGFTNTTDINFETMFYRGQQLGGINLVTGLGSNFISWCENTGDINADAGTVRMYEAPVVVNANMIGPNQDPNEGETQESTQPISFDSSAGTAIGSYLKTLVFMKPLVITYLRSGTRYYRWFYQNFEGNS